MKFVEHKEQTAKDCEEVEFVDELIYNHK